MLNKLSIFKYKNIYINYINIYKVKLLKIKLVLLHPK